MDKKSLLKRFELIVDAFERGHRFGSIEICFNRGQAEVIRTLTSEKFFEREHTQNGRPENR
jgi:hypothetical protein